MEENVKVVETEDKKFLDKVEDFVLDHYATIITVGTIYGIYKITKGTLNRKSYDKGYQAALKDFAGVFDHISVACLGDIDISRF